MRESKQQVLRLGMMSFAGIAFVGCLSVNAQAAAAEAGYAESVLADKPVGYWRFEEQTASAGAVNDAAGGDTKNGAYHNVDLGIPSATVALGSAAGFSGDAAMPSYIDLGADEALMLRGDLTIEWWQNMTGDAAEDLAVIAWASKGESVDTNVLYEMVLRYSEEQKQEKYPRPQFVLGHEYGTGVNVRVPSRTLAQPDRWCHIAVVRDADARTIQYYINGLPAGEPQSYGEGYENPQGGESAGVTIGKLGRFNSRYFQGCLDEVALYDHTLTAERIMAHYRAALDGSSKEHRPQVVAHRGNNRFAPENTLVSYQQALETGAPIVELDLHRSKDGVIVLLHDDTLDRTTNGTGNVNDMTLEQLKSFDAGSWKDVKYAGERIPTLEELAELCKGKAVIMLDLKDPVRRRRDRARCLSA
ncbi:MAG: glycerophosphodiester phosphodiesterase family protein [Phycisphaerales bacterium]